MADISLNQIGFALVIFGIILAFIAMILLVARSQGGGTKSRGAGVLFIGPIPIIFGTDRESAKTVILLAIVLMVVTFVVTLILPFLVR